MRQESPSKYFNNYDHEPKQKLLEDLLVQAIRQNGLMLKYLPRNRFERNHIFGEDISSTFDIAVPIEAWPKTVDNFEGEGNLLSKFGLEVRNQITFTISKRRWREMMTPKLVNENGLPYQDEESEIWRPENSFPYLLESDEEIMDLSRYDPREGDLIFLPMNNQIFEITYVDREALFYQYGKLFTYDIKCELFKYSSEEFSTGIEDIDKFDDIFNLDQNKFTTLLETGDEVLLENGFKIVQENSIPRSNNSDNEMFQNDGEKIVNFEDVSPFIRNKKW